MRAMHVIFVEPSFPQHQREFVRALASAGARVTGIGEVPIQYLDDELRGWLSDYERVPSVCHEPSLLACVQQIQARGWVDRLEATVEAHILPVAHVREQCRIPGTSVETAWLCRDKPSMKERLRRAGVPCAMSAAVASPEEARDFARQVGYPIILKPRSGAGASDTERVDDDAALEQAIIDHRIADGVSVAAEEFIEGHEGFYDSLTIDGTIRHDFVSHYYPGVLEAMRERWITPYLISSNRIGSDSYDEVKEMGRRVVQELGIETSAVHMEWFYGPKGLKFSEVGCRPPGVGTWDLYGAANDLDIYVEWAHAIVHGQTGGQCSRRFSTALIALRPDCDGQIVGYEGLDAIRQAFGEWIIDEHFPPAGHPTQPVEGGYMANAWLRMRHPDYDELRSMLDTVGRTVQVRAR